MSFCEFPDVIVQRMTLIIELVNELSKTRIQIILVVASVLKSVFVERNAKSVTSPVYKVAFVLHNIAILKQKDAIAFDLPISELAVVSTSLTHLAPFTLLLVIGPHANIPVSIGPGAVTPAAPHPLFVFPLHLPVVGRSIVATEFLNVLKALRVHKKLFPDLSRLNH